MSATAAASPPPAPDPADGLLHHRRRGRGSSKRRGGVQVPAAAIHPIAAVLCARVHSELAYAPADRAPESVHALCLALDAALRCRSGGGGGGGEAKDPSPPPLVAASCLSASPSAFLSSSSVSIAKVGAPTELPDAAFVAVALPVTKTARPSPLVAPTEAGVGPSSSLSSSSDKATSCESSEEERKNANAAAAASASAAAASAGEELSTAPLVAALLRAAERLHAAVAQVRRPRAFR